jgi:hypothetical protein
MVPSKRIIDRDATTQGIMERSKTSLFLRPLTLQQIGAGLERVPLLRERKSCNERQLQLYWCLCGHQ